MLHRRHQKRIRHKPDQPLEIKRRRPSLRRRRHEVLLWPRHSFAVHVGERDGEEVVFAVGVGETLARAGLEGGEGLGCGVGDAAEDGVGDHGCEDGAVGVVGVEFADEDGYHGELEDEDDGVEEGLV